MTWSDDYPLSAYDELQGQIVEWETGQALTLGRWLKTAFHPRSVIDVGCGPGLYLLPFKPEAVVLGLDGAPAAGVQLGPGEFQRVDLRQWLPFAAPTREAYDLALCIEVGEHLPQACAAPLVTCLCSLAKVIVFSAATPGQGGVGHIAERPAEEWRKMFKAHGYRAHPLEADLREALAHDPACLPWLVKNVMLLTGLAA